MEETSVLVEGLVHADGTTLNTTREHRWAVTDNPPGADFFNWTARCVSAGAAFNPYKVCKVLNAKQKMELQGFHYLLIFGIINVLCLIINI